MPPSYRPETLNCCFSPAGDVLAVSTPDGRIKTFDTGNGVLISNIIPTSRSSGEPSSSQNGHLTERHTCICWAQPSTASINKQLVVAGTAAGDIKAYDVASAEQLWTCQDCCEGGVSGLAVIGCEEVYGTGADNKVSVLQLSDGKVKHTPPLGKGPFTAAAASQDGQLLALASASAISLWERKTSSRICRFTGHPVATRAVKIASSNDFMASLGQGERSVTLWKLPASDAKPGKKLLPAAAVLSMSAAVVQLDLAPASGGEAGVYVLGVASDGEACVWFCCDGGDGVVQQSVVGRVRGAEGQAGDVLAACIVEGGAAAVGVLLARGSPAKPVFERVRLLRGGAGGSVVELPAAADGVLLPAQTAAKAKAKQAQAAATVLGTDNAGVPILRAGVAETETSKRKKKKKGQEEEAAHGTAPGAAGVSAQAAGTKRRQPEADAGAAMANGGSHGMDMDEEPGASDGEDTLAAQVLRIEEQIDRQQRAQSRTEEAGPSGALPLKADSLAVLLTQAVRSGDKALLERVVEVSDPKVIRNTVQQLSATDAASFLAAAVARMQSRPARGAQLAGWVRAVLMQHAAFLMAAPGAQPTLTTLYQTIESRLAMHKTLLALAGRLDLVLAHSPSTAAGGEDDGAPQAAGGPQVVYEESASDDEEPVAEDALAPKFSDEDSEGSGEDGYESDDLEADDLMGGDDDDDDMDDL